MFVILLSVLTLFLSGCTISATIEGPSRSEMDSSDLVMGKSSGLCSDSYITKAIPLNQNQLLLAGDFSKLGECGSTSVLVDLAANKVINPASESKIQGNIHKVIPDGAGGWYVGGFNLQVDGVRQKLVARIKSDGSLDKNFVAFRDINRSFFEDYNEAVRDMLVVDGKLFLAGSYMVEENPQGGPLDLENGNSLYPESLRGGLFGDGVVSVVVSDGGTGWYIGGSFQVYRGSPVGGLIRVDQNGDIVNGFAPKVLGAVSHLHYDADSDTLFVLGEFTFVDGHLRIGAAAIDTNTGTVKGWAPVITGVSQDAQIGISNTHGKLFLNGSNIEVLGTSFEYEIGVLDLATGAVLGTVPVTNSGGSLFIEDLEAHDDILYIGGQFTHIAGVPRNNVGAVDTGTHAVTAWNPNSNSMVKQIKIAPEGTSIYLGGDFSLVGGQLRQRVAEVNMSNGAVTAFNPGASISNSLYAMAVGADSIYLYGTFSTLGGLPRYMHGALDRTTGAVTNWNPMKTETIFTGGGVGAQLAVNTNAIYVSSGFSSIGGVPTGGLNVLDSTTGATLPFSHNWTREKPRALEVSEDGTLLFVGGSVTGRPDRALEAFHLSDLSPAALDFVGGSGTWKDILDLQIAGNKLYVAGNFTRMGANNLARQFLAAVDITTGNALPWDPAPDSAVRYLEVLNGKMYVGGHFSTISSETREGFAAYDMADDSLLNLVLPVAVNPLKTIVANGENLYLFGDFDGLPKARIFNVVDQQLQDIGQIEGSHPVTGSVSGGRMLLGGNVEIPKSPVTASQFAILNLQTRKVEPVPWGIPEGQLYKVARLSGGLVAIGGLFEDFESGNNFGLILVNPDTGQVQRFSSDRGVTAFVERGGILYVGGEFTEIDGQSRNYLAAIDLTDFILLPWDPGPDDGVNELASFGDWIYAGGYFSSIGGQGISNLARIDAHSGVVDTWDLSVSGDVESFFVAGSKLYVKGEFFQLGGGNVPGLALVDMESGGVASLPFAQVHAGNIEFSGNYIFIFDGVQMSVFDKLTEQPSQAAWLGLIADSQSYVYEIQQMGDFEVLLGNFVDIDGSRSSLRVIRTSDGKYRY